MSEIKCQYMATNSNGNGPGVFNELTLKDCNPSISNEETVSPIQVIMIVVIIVFVGLAFQWLLGHVNRKAIGVLKDDLKKAAAHTSQIITPAE